MTFVNIHEAKTQFSRLLEAVAAGESVTIARAGTPVARLVRYEEEDREQRLGFLAGHGAVPEDFDELEAGPIEALFGAGDAASA
ncbi:type II toxin-antitoxin system Phd/YefM family antitoxin [Brevibacterium marinum]|uniref:Antitoxin n=1 Tax=Brevibacterium marinum TaxID=418643 RepID=A0A846RXT1_9MICO|nr:type II toxin-antitoxin system prevent-host-death family antitoxin [Brevibacterium marinum]NJC55463.1 prevent-host-death family protein [Brevibacterium marinum]